MGQLHSGKGRQSGETAPTGRAGTKLRPRSGNPARTRAKGWAKPLRRGPQGGRFLEFVNLEPGSLPAAMVHWLLHKKARAAPYSVRELADRFNIGMKLASQFLRRGTKDSFGWVEWCEDIVNNWSCLPETQYLHHDGVTHFQQAGLVTTDRTREAC